MPCTVLVPNVAVPVYLGDLGCSNLCKNSGDLLQSRCLTLVFSLVKLLLMAGMPGGGAAANLGWA